jgi:AcrR family transcriptional regulator
MLLSDGDVKPEPAVSAGRSPTRRSTEKVKALLVEVALERFTAGAFETTTTREIADRAGVAESVLFRHFPTKSNLLATAITQPFEAFLADFSDTWESRDPAVLRPDPRNRPAQQAIVTEFVGDLYDNLVAHRDLLRALLAASLADPSIADSVHARLEAIFTPLAEIARTSAEQRGQNTDHPDTDVRGIVAMITAVAVLDDWFLPDPGIGRDRLVHDIADLLFHGLGGPGGP